MMLLMIIAEEGKATTLVKFETGEKEWSHVGAKKKGVYAQGNLGWQG